MSLSASEGGNPLRSKQLRLVSLPTYSRTVLGADFFLLQILDEMRDGKVQGRIVVEL